MSAKAGDTPSFADRVTAQMTEGERANARYALRDNPAKFAEFYALAHNQADAQYFGGMSQSRAWRVTKQAQRTYEKDITTQIAAARARGDAGHSEAMRLRHQLVNFQGLFNGWKSR